MEINQTSDTLSVNQHKYIKDLLAKYSEYLNSDDKACKIPLPAGFKITSEQSDTDTQLGENELAKIPYRELLGSLLWLARCTRPDIANAISILGRYSQGYKFRHWLALIHVLRYVKHTASYQIEYKASHELKLQCYSDADWAGDLDTRKSTSGYIALLCGGPIAWHSCKQTLVSTSTCEAEYIGLSGAGKETQYLRNLLNTFGLDQTEPGDVSVSELYGDNKGANFLADNPKTNNRTKHIEIKYHHIRCLTKRKIMKVIYVPTCDMLADMLTKPLTNAVQLMDHCARFMKLR
jgi:hypothetical protein